MTEAVGPAEREPGRPRILVIQTAFLGDVVLTTPLFRGLRRCFPAAFLSALVTPAAKPLVEEDPHLDRVQVYDKRGGDSLWGMARTLRRGCYDTLVAPHRSTRTALLALASGVPRRVGFADAALRWVYHRTVPRRHDLHEVDRNLSLLRGVDCLPDPSDRVLTVEYTETETDSVAVILHRAGVGAGEPLVGLCAGSVWATKRWLPERFIAVGKTFQDRGFRVVLLGGPGDAEVSARVAAGIGPRAVDAAGRTPLKALAAWMDRLTLVVTNDSAPLHVAAARDVPAVAVFGATTTDLGFGPFHRRSAVAEVSLPCRPCGLHGGRHCRQEHFRCMTDVHPEAVVQAGLELLDQGQIP